MSAMQDEFSSALVDPSKDPAPFPPRRFSVYRNNVASSLSRALRAQFPAVARLLGDETFAKATIAYLRSEPPRSALLFEIGQGFGTFLGSIEALASYPFLGDVARLEHAMALAQHAADGRAIDTSVLASLPESELTRVAFVWHPAARLFASRYPVVMICRQNRDDGEPQPISDWSGETALITRPLMAVDVRVLPPGGFAFLAAIEGGERLAVAAERGYAASPTFDLPANLAGMFAAGAISGARLLPETEERLP